MYIYKLDGNGGVVVNYDGKVKPLKKVVEEISDGSHLALSGFAITRNSIAFAHELIRQNKKNITLSQNVGALDTDLLVAAGVVKKLIYGGGSLDRFGPIYNVNRAIEENKIEVEEYSGLSLTFRRLAGALGINYIPCNSLLGSDILTSLLKNVPDQVKEEKCPFTGERQVLLRALVADYAIIQVNYCDTEGNAVIMGPTWDLKELASACKHLILVTEQIVSPQIFENNPELTTINAAEVGSIVVVPYGSYPTSVYRKYDYDREHLKLYAEAAKTEKGTQKYLEEYVYSVNNFWEYLDKCGGIERLSKLQADPFSGYAQVLIEYWSDNNEIYKR